MTTGRHRAPELERPRRWLPDVLFMAAAYLLLSGVLFVAI